MKTAYDIIKRPIITEQSMEQTEMKRYTFEVAKTANKIEIAKAVEEIFGVKVAKVNTLNMQGKEKRMGARPAGRRPSWKKAVEEIFGVKVKKVNTLNMQGKVKRTGRYPEGRRPAWKKAMVSLTEDSKTIEFFEGMV